MAAILDFDHFHVEPFDTIEFMRCFMTGDLYAGKERSLVIDALCMGGFIAGGFSRTFHHDPLRLRNYVQSIHGDIDLFFRSKKTLDEFLRKNQDYPFRRSLNTWCTPGNSVQIITCSMGQPHDILRMFDISNACVAMTKNSIMRPDGYDELHASKMLHVQRWDDASVARVRKWFCKHEDLQLLHVDCNNEYLRRMHDVQAYEADATYSMMVGVPA